MTAVGTKRTIPIGPKKVVEEQVAREVTSTKMSFSYAIINENDTTSYLIENHLICIKYSTPLPNDELIKKYKAIITSFEHNKTKEFIKLYFGNNAINTTELCEVLPIYST